MDCEWSSQSAVGVSDAVTEITVNVFKQALFPAMGRGPKRKVVTLLFNVQHKNVTNVIFYLDSKRNL